MSATDRKLLLGAGLILAVLYLAMTIEELFLTGKLRVIVLYEPEPEISGTLINITPSTVTEKVKDNG